MIIDAHAHGFCGGDLDQLGTQAAIGQEMESVTSSACKKESRTSWMWIYVWRSLTETASTSKWSIRSILWTVIFLPGPPAAQLRRGRGDQ